MPVGKLAATVMSIALLAGCGLAAPASSAHVRAGVAATAAGLWGPSPVVKPGLVGGRVTLDTLDTPFIKDPSFVDGGRPLDGTRYVAFGDLRALYLKAFDVDGRGGPLAFRHGEVKLGIAGLAPDLDSVWAPQLRVAGQLVELYYCAGAMPPPDGPHWSTFRLHRATAPLADVAAALAAGRSPTFADQGAILTDLDPFGDGATDLGVIDPCLFVNRRGRAYMTYTAVRPGAPGRAHEERVRYRAVDPADPARALGPDQPLYDGVPGSEDDGVAEAQDVVTLGGHAYVFISSRPGDVDQRLLVAPVGDDLGRVTRDALREFMYPGAEDWKARAVGSSGAVAIDGTAYMIYQGLDASHRFGLGWTTLSL